MRDLIFYTNPMSRGRIVRWMLEEIGTTYQTQIIEHGPDMKSEPFIGINPMGKVPAITHLGQTVTETPAILAYLADAFPEAGLAPELNQRGAYYRWLFFAAGPLEAAVTNKHMGFEISDDPRMQGMSGYGNFDLLVKVLAQLIPDSGFITGKQFSAADIYLGSHLIWGLEFGTLPDLPEFRKYTTQFTERAAYLRAQEIDNALLPESPNEE